MSIKERVIIFSIDLEKRNLSSIRLLDKVLERDQSFENHATDSIVNSSFPIVIVFFHFTAGFRLSIIDIFFNGFQELISDDIVFFNEFINLSVKVIIEIVVEFHDSGKSFFFFEIVKFISS